MALLVLGASALLGFGSFLIPRRKLGSGKVGLPSVVAK